MVPTVEDAAEVAIGFVVATVVLALFYALIGVSNMEELTEKIRSNI